MDHVKRRAWWAHRQGLDGSLEGKTASEVLARSGWARSVGGVGPYLTLWARAGIGRAAADAAVAALDIHELPSARGCTYVVPAQDFALALTMAQQAGQQEMKVAAKLGVTAGEIDALCQAVVKAVAHEALDPDGIREAVGPAARSLGAEGKKKGLSTTLPLALGRLQEEGRIRRVPTDGRLDQQRYRYTAWKPGPLGASALSLDQARTQLAERYFSWIGPATVAEFAWFAGLGVKASQQAVAALELVDVGEGAFLLPRDVDAWKAFKTPRESRPVLVSSLDAVHALRRDVKLLLDEADRDRELMGDKGAQPAGVFYDLPSHAILDRGRLIGLWEYDPDEHSIAWMSFVGKSATLVEAVRKTQTFVAEELGDARAFSLDSPKSRAGRIQALRAAS